MAKAPVKKPNEATQEAAPAEATQEAAPDEATQEAASVVVKHEIVEVNGIKFARETFPSGMVVEVRLSC